MKLITETNTKSEQGTARDDAQQRTSVMQRRHEATFLTLMLSSSLCIWNWAD